MNHPRAAEQRAVRVDDGRTIEATVPVPLVEVEDNDDAELASAGVKTNRSSGPGTVSAIAPRRAAGRPLREEALERDFGKYHELGAIARRTLESRKPPADVVCLVSDPLTAG